LLDRRAPHEGIFFPFGALQSVQPRLFLPVIPSGAPGLRKNGFFFSCRFFLTGPLLSAFLGFSFCQTRFVTPIFARRPSLLSVDSLPISGPISLPLYPPHLLFFHFSSPTHQPVSPFDLPRRLPVVPCPPLISFWPSLTFEPTLPSSPFTR